MHVFEPFAHLFSLTYVFLIHFLGGRSKPLSSWQEGSNNEPWQDILCRRGDPGHALEYSRVTHCQHVRMIPQEEGSR